jgi:hypothetical protein
LITSPIRPMPVAQRQPEGDDVEVLDAQARSPHVERESAGRGDEAAIEREPAAVEPGVGVAQRAVFGEVEDLRADDRCDDQDQPHDLHRLDVQTARVRLARGDHAADENADRDRQTVPGDGQRAELDERVDPDRDACRHRGRDRNERARIRQIVGRRHGAWPPPRPRQLLLRSDNG